MSVCRLAVWLYLSIGKLVVSQLRWSTGRVPHCVGLLAGSQRCVGLLVVSQLVSVYWRALRLCWSIGRVPVCVWSVGGLVYGGCCSRRFNSSKTCSGRDIDRLGKTASSVKASMLLTRSTFCTTTLAAWGQGIVLLQHKPWSMVPHKRRHAVPSDLVPVSQTGEELKCRLRSNDSIHRGLYSIVVKQSCKSGKTSDSNQLGVLSDSWGEDVKPWSTHVEAMDTQYWTWSFSVWPRADRSGGDNHPWQWYRFWLASVVKTIAEYLLFKCRQIQWQINIPVKTVPGKLLFWRYNNLPTLD